MLSLSSTSITPTALKTTYIVSVELDVLPAPELPTPSSRRTIPNKLKIWLAYWLKPTKSLIRNCMNWPVLAADQAGVAVDETVGEAAAADMVAADQEDMEVAAEGTATQVARGITVKDKTLNL